MLHPATPFITEHIYQGLTQKKVLESKIEVIKVEDKNKELWPIDCLLLLISKIRNFQQKKPLVKSKVSILKKPKKALEKQLKLYEVECQRSQQLLANCNFLQKAPPPLIAEEKRKLIYYQTQKQKLQTELEKSDKPYYQLTNFYASPIECELPIEVIDSGRRYMPLDEKGNLSTSHKHFYNAEPGLGTMVEILDSINPLAMGINTIREVPNPGEVRNFVNEHFKPGHGLRGDWFFEGNGMNPVVPMRLRAMHFAVRENVDGKEAESPEPNSTNQKDTEHEAKKTLIENNISEIKNKLSSANISTKQVIQILENQGTNEPNTPPPPPAPTNSLEPPVPTSEQINQTEEKLDQAQANNVNEEELIRIIKQTSETVKHSGDENLKKKKEEVEKKLSKDKLRELIREEIHQELVENRLKPEELSPTVKQKLDELNNDNSQVIRTEIFNEVGKQVLSKLITALQSALKLSKKKELQNKVKELQQFINSKIDYKQNAYKKEKNKVDQLLVQARNQSDQNQTPWFVLAEKSKDNFINNLSTKK
ncbi:16646_t:CDS:2 [Funneliformis geosporum]|uniref:16646_t:CDS:1 n=1 Tax=Funneliformis geosporum TaxID=1117311 RepID=A0A9W4SAN2_9GLOM|nr:16646_t:CDS:2 [Funneliformis geosporum]